MEQVVGPAAMGRVKINYFPSHGGVVEDRGGNRDLNYTRTAFSPPTEGCLPTGGRGGNIITRLNTIML
jgi:hypothetical protein